MSDSTDLQAPELYTNREISWLRFNERVLASARRPAVELLERLKFIAIAASNLDEFYMVRVAALIAQELENIDAEDPSGDDREPSEVLTEIGETTRALGRQAVEILTAEIIPALDEHGVCFLTPDTLDASQKSRARTYYEKEVHPCLTPIAIDPTHPFPHLRNKSLNIAFRIDPHDQDASHPLKARDGVRLALVQVPSVLSRFVPFRTESHRYAFMPLETVIAMHASELFPGHHIIEATPFRVTRASDLDLDEEATDNLLTRIQDELRRRDRGRAIRLEILESASEGLTELLRGLLDVPAEHVHQHRGFIVTSALFSVYSKVELPALKYKPHVPLTAAHLQYEPSLFRAIKERDIFLYHPYDSFSHVVDLMNQAADDPDVVAIKQTLYRTNGNSPFVRALARAAANGKQVTALVELKARFDEAANIHWARKLEEGGVHVVYGLLGLKTHSKLLLIIRREGDRLRRYLHLGTGNYNSSTARLYTDLSLMTAHDGITKDAMLLFNVLTGYAEMGTLENLVVAPFHLRESVIDLLKREMAHAKAGRPAALIAKMNAIVDPDIIEALYAASQAGVQIDLLIRGICCLRPGIKGISDNIRVRAVIDRFLEHSRITWWANGGEPEVYATSADWMPRNLNRRIEVAFPILDPGHKERIRTELLETELRDNVSTWRLDSDGRYSPIGVEDALPVRLQEELIRKSKARQPRSPTRVRREFTAAGSSSLTVSPALRAAQNRGRRRST